MQLNPAENDPVKVADWIEYQAITSLEGSCSLEDAKSQIDTDGSLGDEGDVPHEESERLVASSSLEIKRRSRIGQDAYPFTFSEGVLQAQVEPIYLPYIFCLLLADRESYSPNEQEPAKLFEHLVCEAMKYYLGGEAVRFGTPRDTMPTGVLDAINELSRLTRNRRLKDGYPTNAIDKDLGLDVVAWKEFPDQNWGQVEIYMQCATSESWETKKHDCDLDEWRGILYWPFYPVKGLAIPYVVSSYTWERETAGVLLMDRLRISCVLAGNDSYNDKHGWWAWCQERIKNARDS